MFGSLTLCRYTYSYHNNRYIIEQGDMTCLRSSKRSLKPSKTKYPLGKHPNNLMPYKIIPRYGLRAEIYRCVEHARPTYTLRLLFCRAEHRSADYSIGRAHPRQRWRTWINFTYLLSAKKQEQKKNRPC